MFLARKTNLIFTVFIRRNSRPFSHIQTRIWIGRSIQNGTLHSFDIKSRNVLEQILVSHEVLYAWREFPPKSSFWNVERELPFSAVITKEKLQWYLYTQNVDFGHFSRQSRFCKINLQFLRAALSVHKKRFACPMKCFRNSLTPTSTLFGDLW